MTKLEELIYSLATVIVRYHDSQPKVKKLVEEIEPTLLRKKSREFAIAIIQNKEIKYDLQLKGLIDACTKGYPDRKHFLAFILNEINFLKTQLDKKVSFKPQELEEYQRQVTQLFIDFRQLLKTPKDTMYKVSYSGESATSIDLSGLINNAWVGNVYCNSGLLLIEEVLGRFHMTITNSDDEVRELAVSLCMENQNALAVADGQRQKLELETQKLEQESQLDTQKLQIESQKSELDAQKSELDAQKSELAAQKSELAAQKLQLDSQKSELEAQYIQIDAQKLQIKNQKSELDAQKLQLKTQKSELDALKLQVKTHKSELDAQKHQVRTQKSEFDAQKLQLVTQKLELETQKIDLATKNTDQQTTIESLQSALDKTKAELQQIQLEFQLFKEKKQKEEQSQPLQARRYPAYSPLLGFGPYGMMFNQSKGLASSSRFFPSANEGTSQQDSTQDKERLDGVSSLTLTE